MVSDKTTARAVGAFFLSSYITNVIGSSYVESLIFGDETQPQTASNYLTELEAHKTMVIFAEVLEIYTAVALVTIAILMFPIFKRHSENVARGYLVFRLMEAIMMSITIVLTLSLLTFSEQYVDNGIVSEPYWSRIGNLAVIGRYWAFKMILIFLVIGYLIFFYSMYETRLIPRFISIWGVIGVILVLIATMLSAFGFSGFLVTDFPGMLFYILGALNEPFLALWLMIKGFSSTAIAE